MDPLAPLDDSARPRVAALLNLTLMRAAGWHFTAVARRHQLVEVALAAVTQAAAGIGCYPVVRDAQHHPLRPVAVDCSLTPSDFLT